MQVEYKNCRCQHVNNKNNNYNDNHVLSFRIVKVSLVLQLQRRNIATTDHRCSKYFKSQYDTSTSTLVNIYEY